MRSTAVVSAALCLLASNISASPVSSRLAARQVPATAPAPAAAAPPASIYPQKAAGDAPYSVPEATLKGAIKLPAGFPAAGKMPVILAPGTGVTGTQTFTGNFMKLMANNPTMEAVVLDIPNSLLDDVQTNAEFLAYSINSVSAMSGGMNVSVVTWSQGSLDMQWAVKYWPSTRPIVSDFVAISPDLAGTTVGGPLQATSGLIAIAPALLQQEAKSKLVATLRANGGDSAIVPTTTIYSSADEVVSPQTGSTASGFFKQANGVPAANYQVQVVCPKQPAGGDFTHEGVLYNSFAVAIAMDAFANPGPGDVKRLDLQKVCSTALAPGLTAADKKTTDATIQEAASNILKYQSGGATTKTEPPIKAYAKKASAAAPAKAAGRKGAAKL